MSVRSQVLPAIAALLSLVLFAVSANIVFASLVRVSGTFGIAPEYLATVSAVQFAGFFASSLAGGFAADLVGKRRVLQCGCGLVTTGGMIWAFAPAAWVVFVGGWVMGMGGGILEAISSALLTDLYPRRRKLVMNLSQVAYCGGAVSGPALMGWLLPLGISWRWFFGATAFGAAILFVLYEASSVSRCEANGPPSRDSGWGGVWGLTVALAAPCIVIFLYVFAEMGTATFMTLYLQDILQAPERWAIGSLSIFWAMMIIGRLVCAFLPEHHAYEWVIAFLMVLAGCAALCQVWVVAWPLSVVLFATSGLAFAGTWPLIISMVAMRHSTRSGAAVGVTVAAGSVGCIAAPAVISPLFASGHASLMFAVAAGALFVGGALVLLCPFLHTRFRVCEEAIDDEAD